MIMVEYQCKLCGEIFESLEDRPAPASRGCKKCDGEAVRIISPVKGKVVWGYAEHTGGVDPTPPGCLNTQHLARG